MRETVPKSSFSADAMRGAFMLDWHLYTVCSSSGTGQVGVLLKFVARETKQGVG